MALDDQAANGQAQSQTVRLRGDEGIEYGLELLRIDAWPGIFHRHNDGIAAVPLRAHAQDSIIAVDRVHGFDRVVYQVDEDLLQLTAMTHDERQLRRQLGLRGDAVILQLFAQRL